MKFKYTKKELFDPADQDYLSDNDLTILILSERMADLNSNSLLRKRLFKIRARLFHEETLNQTKYS